MVSSEASTKKLVIVDYGVNNVGSVANMVRRLDIAADVVSNVDGLRDATAIILPGIGAFDAGITNLKREGLDEAIRQLVLEHRVPILGICLGMQLLSRGSQEGKLAGLELVPAETRKLDVPSGLVVPHMGWNETEC